MRKILLVSLLLLSSSCQVYKSSFEYVPEEGIPCKSVTEIESMIVESESGPNFILETDHDAQTVIRKSNSRSSKSEKSKRIWIEESQKSSDLRVEGHYIYFDGDRCD